MNADIIDAINKNLPSAVGEVLRKRLEQAADLEKRFADLEGKYNDVAKERNRLVDVVTQGKTIAEREAAADKKLEELKKKEIAAALIDLREHHAQERVQELKELTLAVFANSRMKYSTTERVMHPIQPFGTNQYGTTVTGENTKTTVVQE